MGAVFLLLLCFLQGYRCAVQTYSELVYPIPRHRVQNLENPVPELSPSSFQCSQGVQCGYCGPLHTLSDRYPTMTRFAEGSDVELLALISDIGGGSVDVSLCVRNDSSKNENEACIEDIPLYSTDVESFKDQMTSEKQIFTSVSLPQGVTCQHCILRWSRTAADPSCPGCTVTTINCADVAVDARAPRHKRQSGPQKSKKKSKKTKKTKMPLLPPIRAKKTTTAPGQSTSKAPSFFEMIKMMVAGQQGATTVTDRGLNVMRNTKPPANHFASNPLYVSTPKQRVPAITKSPSNVYVTPSPPGYANIRNVQKVRDINSSTKWQQQSRYSSGVNNIEKNEFRDKDGIIQKAAPSNAFLAAIRRYKKEKLGLDELIHNDKPQLGEFHDNKDITRVKKMEKPENIMPSDNMLLDKDNKNKGMLPSKHDYFDRITKAPRSTVTKTTLKVNPTITTVKVNPTKTTMKMNPTTTAPKTVPKGQQKGGIRNLARNTFLEAIMKMTGGSTSLPGQYFEVKVTKAPSINTPARVEKVNQQTPADPFLEAITRQQNQQGQEVQPQAQTMKHSQPPSTPVPTRKLTTKETSKKALLPKWGIKKSKTTKYTTASTLKSTPETTTTTTGTRHTAQMSTKYESLPQTYPQQEFPNPEYLPLNEDPDLNFFVILPPMDKAEIGREVSPSQTTVFVDTSPFQEATTNTINTNPSTQSVSKSTQPPPNINAAISSGDFTPTQTTFQTKYRTTATHNLDVNLNSGSTLKQKSSPSGLLARLDFKKPTKTTKTTTMKKVTSSVPFVEDKTPSNVASSSTFGEPLTTDRVTSSPYLPSTENRESSKSSLLLPFSKNTDSPKSSPYLPFSGNTETSTTYIPNETSKMTTIHKSNPETKHKSKSLLDTLPKSAKTTETTISSGTDLPVTTQMTEETPINDVSALAFKELFEPSAFNEIKSKMTTGQHSTLSTQTTKSTQSLKTLFGPENNSKTEFDKLLTDGLQAEMRKKVEKAKGYDLLEKQVHDKMIDSKVKTESLEPIYLDTVHEDMYKTLKNRKSPSTPSTTTQTTTTERTKEGLLSFQEPISTIKRQKGLLSLLEPVVTETKKSGLLLPFLEMPAKSTTQKSSRKPKTTLFSTTETPFMLTTTQQTTSSSSAPFQSSLMEKMRELQELQLQKLQREIENLKMKLLEFHQHSMVSKVAITQAPTTQMTTTTTESTTTKITTTKEPTTRIPETQKPTTTVPTTTPEPTTTTPPPTTTPLPTTTPPPTTTPLPTTTPPPTTTTLKTTTTEEPSTTTEIPTSSTTTATTTTIPTTTTESIAVLMRNFLKIFRPMLYRELHMSPQERVTQPVVIPMTMIRRTTRSPTSTSETTQRPTTPTSPTTTTTTTTTPVPTTTFSPTTTTTTTTTTRSTTTYPPTTTTTTTPEPTTTRTTLSEKMMLKQLLREHHPDVYNRLYHAKTSLKAETTKTTSEPTTDPLTEAMDPFMELMEMAESSSTSSSASTTTTTRVTKPTTRFTTRTSPPTTTTTIRTTPSTNPTTRSTTQKPATPADREVTIPQKTTVISFQEFLERAKLANIPLPPKIREELQNVFEKSTARSTASTARSTTSSTGSTASTKRFTTRIPQEKIIPVDPQLIMDFERLQTSRPARRWNPPAPIKLIKVKSPQEFTTPFRTTFTTRKPTTVTPAPTRKTTPAITAVLQKYREMYEQGVNKQKIVDALFQEIDINTVDRTLLNEIFSSKSPTGNYSPSTTQGYRYETEPNYGPNPVLRPSGFQPIPYSEVHSNQDGNPGLSAFDNRVRGIPVIPLDRPSTRQPFRFGSSFRMGPQDPVGWPSQVHDVRMYNYEYMNNYGEVSANSIDKNQGEHFQSIQGPFDSIAGSNPNAGFVSNNNEGFIPNTKPPMLQLENTVASRNKGLSGHNHGPLVVGPSGSLMDLGMVNKLQNAERPGGGTVIMSKSLGANLVLHAQDTIGGGAETGSLSQNPHDLGPQDFTIDKRRAGSLSNAGSASSSHLSAPGDSQPMERFRLRRSTRNHHNDPYRRREYMLEEHYLVTSEGKVACAAEEKLECIGVGDFKDVAGINWFCLSMCEGDRCPSNKCQCGCRDQNTDMWRPITVK